MCERVCCYTIYTQIGVLKSQGLLKPTSGSHRKHCAIKMPKPHLMQNHREMCVCVLERTVSHICQCVDYMKWQVFLQIKGCGFKKLFECVSDFFLELYHF